MINVLKKIGLWLLKNYRWFLPLILIVIWLFNPHKHIISFVTGGAVVGFIWWAYNKYVDDHLFN